MFLIATILGVIVRPVSVLTALAKTTTPFNERVFIGFISPREIIAVAIWKKSLFDIGTDTGCYLSGCSSKVRIANMTRVTPSFSRTVLQ